MSIGLTDILAPLGSFPLVEDVSLKGGFQAVDDIAARDAITSVSRKAGMLVWAEDEGSLWQLDADLVTWIFLQLKPSVDYSLCIHTYPLLAGIGHTDLLAGSELVIGSVKFDPNSLVPVAGGRTRVVKFKVLVETTNAANTVNVQLYDKDGIIGAPSLITSSAILAKTDTSSAYYEVTVTELATVTTAGIIECRLWMGAAGTERVICSMAKLDVTWTG